MLPQVIGTQLAQCDIANNSAIFQDVAFRGQAGQVLSVGFSGTTAYRTLVLQASVSLVLHSHKVHAAPSAMLNHLTSMFTADIKITVLLRARFRKGLNLLFFSPLSLMLSFPERRAFLVSKPAQASHFGLHIIHNSTNHQHIRPNSYTVGLSSFSLIFPTSL